MASPQIENGFTSISNELLEALCKTKLNSEESRVYFAILRETYGKKNMGNGRGAVIPLPKLVTLTNIRRCHISKTIKRLGARGIVSVTQTGNSKSLKYALLKDYDKWKVLPKQVSVTQTGNEVLPKQVTLETQIGNTLVRNQLILEGLQPPKESIKESKEKNKATTKKPSSPKVPANSHSLLTSFKKEYMCRRGVEYIIDSYPKAYKRINAALEHRSLEDWLGYIPKFFEKQKDPDNHSLYLLLSCVNGIEPKRPEVFL